ncbi:MAG: ABC transporter permease subunit, partial [Dehalococcoidia bacterium]
MLDFLDIFQHFTIPVRDWVDDYVVGDIIPAIRPFASAAGEPITALLTAIDSVLQSIPALMTILVITLATAMLATTRIAIFAGAGLLVIGFLNVWPSAMTTLAAILTAVTICVVIGVPIGILAARSARVESTVRPILDIMQTTPAFAYLIPVVMLLSAGTLAATIAVIIFAIPPLIRLTNLGIRQVNEEVVEAAYAFGATPRQVLFEVQLPLALRTIMAGLNQTVMLAMSMVVIAAMIGAGGLGGDVLRGIRLLEVGQGFVGSLGIVLLAIILDRITQSMGQGTGFKVRLPFR